MHAKTFLSSALVILLSGLAPLMAADVAAIRFHGKVTDPADRPLPETTVQINRVSGARLIGDLAARNTQTDSNGTYELVLEIDKAGVTKAVRCELFYVRKGFVRTRRQVEVPPRDGHVQEIDITLTPGLVLAGSVRPPGRHLLKVSGTQFEEYYVTDADGVFEVYVPPGEYDLLVQHQGHALQLTGVKAGSTDLLLQPEPFVWSEDRVGRAFDGFWEAMDRRYSYFFLRPEVDWAALRDEFRPRAVRATNARELAEVLRQMLAPFRDLHVWIQTEAGRVSTHSSSYAYNGNGKLTRAAVEEIARFGRFAAVGKTREDGFGYFVVADQSSATPELVQQAVSAIRNLRDVPGFIVDLRTANGGGEPLAREIASVFCATGTVYAKSKYRNGPRHTDFTEAFDRTMSASDEPFTKPVVCLIGPGAVSSGEAFVKMMACLPHVTTVGMPTRGASGNPKPYELKGTSITVFFSTWVDLLPDGRVIEGKGVPPDVLVDEPAVAYAERDPTLEMGLKVLREKLQPTPVRTKQQ